MSADFTHKEDPIRQEVPLSESTRPCLDLGPKSNFEKVFHIHHKLGISLKD